MSRCDWVDNKKDRSSTSINPEFEEKIVAYYKDSMINLMYHLKEASIKISPEWRK